MAQRQNYVERAELNKKRRLEAGLVSERFPEVSDIAIHMTYYQKGETRILMVRQVNFWPSRYAYFNMDCLVKGCVDGGFDLTSVIKDMIKNHKKSEKGKLLCNGKGETLSSDHASVAYEISITYNRLS
ncbi:MAG: hypothetical protein AB1638_00490 [Nitrospirota bacterium]